MDTQPPLEDINAIVTRFQAWAGAQTPALGKHGVRELTYEEAIRASKRQSVTPKPAIPTAGGKKSQPPVGKSADQQAKPRKRVSSHPVVKRKCKTKALLAAKTAAKTQDIAVQPTAIFRQVLAEQVAPMPALAAKPRTTALSLRVSSDEHSLLKARAAEANLSVSAYLRACLFEVDDLRAQLRQLRLAHEPMLVHRSASVGVFVSCARFMQRLFRGKTTTLAVRA